ncbi:MAG: glycerol acyltransferase [Bacteroidetes bacterium 4572_77]|nr:MAG: glycerol acyltransferase [Bacteroidetes bacterium 4572_77]
MKFSTLVLKLLGWTSLDEFPPIKKSVIIFAPHTSYWDGFFGKLYFMSINVNYKFLSKQEFFTFPLKYVFSAFGAIPVIRDKTYIDQIVQLFKANKELHIILSPEGQLPRTDHWKKGFYYMANKANVPIIVGYIDYKNKEMGIKRVIRDTSNMKETMENISLMYKGVQAKYPKDFALDKRYS